MQTGADIITEFLVRNNRTTTDSFITDGTLDRWLNNAHVWAAGYHKWPFTEQLTSLGTYGAETSSYSTFNVKSDSVRFLAVATSASDISSYKRFKKVNQYDYFQYREDNSQGTEKIFTDVNRTLFINPNAGVSGDVIALFQYQPSSVDASSTTTVFTDYDNEGNEALVLKMSAYLKYREHQTYEAQVDDQTAAAKLNELWRTIQDEQAMYQPGPATDGMYKRFDVLRGGFKEDIFRRDQWGL